MELWIRSQDKYHLVEATEIDLYVDNKNVITVNGYPFGSYKTKERALEVLDEIRKCIVDKKVLYTCNCLLTLVNKNTINEVEKIIDRTSKIAVYEMPEE